MCALGVGERRSPKVLLTPTQDPHAWLCLALSGTVLELRWMLVFSTGQQPHGGHPSQSRRGGASLHGHRAAGRPAFLTLACPTRKEQGQEQRPVPLAPAHVRALCILQKSPHGIEGSGERPAQISNIREHGDLEIWRKARECGLWVSKNRSFAHIALKFSYVSVLVMLSARPSH